MKKFDQVNPVIGELAAQVKARKLTEQEVNQKLLDNFEADQLQARLDKLRYGSTDDNDDDDNKKGPGGASGGTPVKVPLLDNDEELQRRLDRLLGNVSAEQNSELIAQQNSENFFNRRFKQSEKELTALRKGAEGNFGKKRSSIEPSLKLGYQTLHHLHSMNIGMELLIRGFQIIRLSVALQNLHFSIMTVTFLL